ARDYGQEIRRLSLGGDARIVGVDDAERETGLAHLAQVAGEDRVARRGAVARLEVDERRAHRPERLEVGFPVAGAYDHALLRELASRRGPVAALPPQPAAGSGQDQRQQRDDTRAPRNSALPAHDISDRPLLP